MNKINIKIFFTVLFLSFCGIIPISARAAVFSLKPEKESVLKEEEFRVSLFLDTRNHNINTMKGKVIFPPELLEFRKTVQENSIVSFWVEPPEFSGKGEISFGGVVPGGFSGEEGLVLGFIFSAKKSGLAELDMREVQILLNDSHGTPLGTIWSKGSILIGGESLAAQDGRVSWEDREPPESFRAEVASQQDVFDGQWFVAFEAQDRGSGIDHYEIQETKTGEPSEEKWTKTQRGPFLLLDQKLRSYIFIRAVDKENNVRIEMLYPPKKPDYLKYFLAAFAGAVTIFIGWNFFGKKIFMKNS